MEFTGEVKKKIVKTGVTKAGNAYKAFQYKIEEVTGGLYPQSMLADVFGDKVEELNEGDQVTVHFNMKCNEYEGKLYGKNEVWRISDLVRGSSVQEQQSYDPLASVPAGAVCVGPGPTQNDDLPF